MTTSKQILSDTKRLNETKTMTSTQGDRNKNLRGTVVEIHSLEIRIFHVRTFCKSLELQLVQIECVQVLKETINLTALVKSC